MMEKLTRTAALSALGALGYYVLWRPRPLATPEAHPAETYDIAMRQIRALQAEDGPEIKAICRTQLLTHGKRTPTAVVLLHGYSSSPHQYHVLGPQLFERGHNVLIPRYPYHGHVARVPTHFWQMPLEAVLQTVYAAVDMAQGLGEQVVVMGLSFGGALGAWLAHHRRDIQRAVIVSPALGFRRVAGWKRRPVAGLGRYTRPRFEWWDAKRKEAGGVYHAYAGWSTRGAAEMMRLGILLEDLARQAGPRAQSVRVVLNPADTLLDLDPIHRLANRWQRHDPSVELVVLPMDWDLRHDLIEPEAERAQIEKVYPVLIDLAEGRDATAISSLQAQQAAPRPG